MGTTNPPRVEIDALDGSGCGMRAVFTRQGDRYDHAIMTVSPRGETPLLLAENLPLQEAVDHREADGKRTLLFTGASDGVYWSAAVAAIVDVRLAILGFDLACRAKSGLNSPAVTYQLAAGVVLRDERLVLADGREVRVCGAAMPTNIATEFVPTCRVDAADCRVMIVSLYAPHVSTRNAARWRYELSLAPQD